MRRSSHCFVHEFSTRLAHRAAQYLLNELSQVGELNFACAFAPQHIPYEFNQAFAREGAIIPNAHDKIVEIDGLLARQIRDFEDPLAEWGRRDISFAKKIKDSNLFVASSLAKHLEPVPKRANVCISQEEQISHALK